jgi:hypothetical protein
MISISSNLNSTNLVVYDGATDTVKTTNFFQSITNKNKSLNIYYESLVELVFEKLYFGNKLTPYTSTEISQSIKRPYLHTLGYKYIMIDGYYQLPKMKDFCKSLKIPGFETRLNTDLNLFQNVFNQSLLHPIILNFVSSRASSGNMITPEQPVNHGFIKFLLSTIVSRLEGHSNKNGSSIVSQKSSIDTEVTLARTTYDRNAKSSTPCVSITSLSSNGSKKRKRKQINQSNKRASGHQSEFYLFVLPLKKKYLFFIYNTLIDCLISDNEEEKEEEEDAVGSTDLDNENDNENQNIEEEEEEEEEEKEEYDDVDSTANGNQCEQRV